MCFLFINKLLIKHFINSIKLIIKDLSFLRIFLYSIQSKKIIQLIVLYILFILQIFFEF